MTTKTSLIIIGALFIISAAVGFYFYPLFPDQIASHWGFNGQVNGYMGKFWGLALLPILMVVLTGFFLWLPKIDPLKENVAIFRDFYNSIVTVIISFLFYIHMLTVFWNAGFRFDMGTFIAPAIAVLWYFIGVALPETRRNWFMGIRTPWTLSSDRVWKETHEFGGKLFKLSALAALLGVFFPSAAIWLVIVPILFSTLATVIYSYLSFKRK